MTSGSQPELLPGLRETVRRARTTRVTTSQTPELAGDRPVARVLVDLPLAHLDRPFDYAVPASMASTAVPGARVKVRFAGQEVAGFVIERIDRSEHPTALHPLRRVVSAEPVLAPQIVDLVGRVAEHYAGTRSDVLRLAVPPRHAKVEQEQSPPAGPLCTVAAEWPDYPQGPAFLAHLRAGGSPRAVWSAAPGDDWPDLVASAAAATYQGGRGVLICVPDKRDLERADRALTKTLGAEHHVTLTADSGPAKRYREFLAISRGARRVVVGTRAAAFAPVHDLGLVILWDPGDDLLIEPRAPYPHVLKTLVLRAHLEDTAALIGGFAPGVDADQLVRSGWARELSLPRDSLRQRAAIAVAGASDFELERDPMARGARLPKQVHDLIGEAAAAGPVLVQTPRKGYAASLACDSCRTPARCVTCEGPLVLRGSGRPPACRWCGVEADSWSCRACGRHGLRAPVVGEARTAEELGRAFPGALVRSSSKDHVLAEVDDRPQIVVATPGAEPVAAGGYRAVIILDTWLMLGRVGLRSGEEACRRWANAIGLLQPGGRALLVGDPATPEIQAMVRWDPRGFAQREAAERGAAHLPPASELAIVTGPPGAVDDVLTLLTPPPGLEVLGPLETEPGTHRVVVRVPRTHGAQLTVSLSEVQRVRSARKLEPVRIQVDPFDL